MQRERHWLFKIINTNELAIKKLSSVQFAVIPTSSGLKPSAIDFNQPLFTIHICIFGKNYKVPNIYIIAGCNGAGKTTASFTILPEILDCKEFVNADEIAKGISPFQQETVSFYAGRIMLERINELIDLEVDFAFETTLTTIIYKNTIELARKKGYKITLLFFWLDNVELAIERVATRVSEGGHNIPNDVIVRRYFKGLKNLTDLFIDICDYWIVIDNSKNPYTFIAEGSINFPPTIYNNKIWREIKTKNYEK